MSEDTSKRDHIVSAVTGAGAVGAFAFAVDGAVAAVAVTGVAKVVEFKPYSALQGATMSLVAIFGTTTHDLNNKLEDLHANNTIIPDTEIVTELKSLKPDVDLSTIVSPAINREVTSLLIDHYQEQAFGIKADLANKVKSLKSGAPVPAAQ